MLYFSQNFQQMIDQIVISDMSRICITFELPYSDDYVFFYNATIAFCFLLYLDFTACFRNCHNCKGLCYLQVSVRSHCSVGLLVRWIPCPLYSVWLFFSVLPIQREVSSTGSFIPKHQLPCLLQYCLVSELFDYIGYSLSINYLF